jgi:hypothetical protein
MGTPVRGHNVRAVAAIFNLNHPAHTVHWHFIQLSVANVIVVVLMLIVFAAAILLPFPHPRDSEELP